MKSRPIAIVAINYVLISTALGADTAEKSTSPETTAIANQAAEYAKAYNAGDAKALARYFTDDAEYTDENGQLTQGRSDIEQLLRDTFADNKGATLDVQVDSVRPLDSDLFEEKGTTTVTSSSGDRQSSSYTALHARKNGEWLISRLFEFPAAEPTPGQQLSQLAWMVGTWKDKGGSTSVETKADWARGNNFLTRTFKVSKGDDVLLEGWQIIGWDPVENRIRSWIFDSEGGYGQAFWTRDGNRWLLKETRVSADGSESSAEQTLTYVDQDHCTFESANRTLNGDLQPNIDKIEIDRVKSQ
ncbi:MAG TPA: SgcJ/EcaC family oxidoreductase [Chthoniobacterales bacterium]|nr:SgcJ/EcaC family oxidoreductase [Chthoniobacterales bacterium]